MRQNAEKEREKNETQEEKKTSITINSCFKKSTSILKKNRTETKANNV